MAHKEAGIPLAEDIVSAIDLPHTLTSAIAYRARLNSFYELPKDKQPPRDLWDKPYKLAEFLDTVWDDDKNDGKKKGKDFYEVNLEEVE
jgi:hypothetical protein